MGYLLRAWVADPARRPWWRLARRAGCRGQDGSVWTA